MHRYIQLRFSLHNRINGWKTLGAEKVTSGRVAHGRSSAVIRTVSQVAKASVLCNHSVVLPKLPSQGASSAEPGRSQVVLRMQLSVTNHRDVQSCLNSEKQIPTTQVGMVNVRNALGQVAGAAVLRHSGLLWRPRSTSRWV